MTYSCVLAVDGKRFDLYALRLVLTAHSFRYFAMTYAPMSLSDILFVPHLGVQNLAQRGCKGKAAIAFANFPVSFDAVMQLGEDAVTAPFAYDAHGHSRIAFTSTEPSVRLVLKFSHQSYKEDDNKKESELPLDEKFAPRVYGFVVKSVFNHDASLLLLAREDITLRDKFFAMTQRPATPGKVTFLRGIVVLIFSLSFLL